MDSNSWAYHVLNPSTIITRIFKAYSEVNNEEREKIEPVWRCLWSAFAELKFQERKFNALSPTIAPLQWSIITILAIIMIIAFNFIQHILIH
jgi:hypothetical protein